MTTSLKAVAIFFVAGSILSIAPYASAKHADHKHVALAPLTHIIEVTSATTTRTIATTTTATTSVPAAVTTPTQPKTPSAPAGTVQPVPTNPTTAQSSAGIDFGDIYTRSTTLPLPMTIVLLAIALGLTLFGALLIERDPLDFDSYRGIAHLPNAYGDAYGERRSLA